MEREFGRVTTDGVTCPVGQVLQVTAANESAKKLSTSLFFLP
jgi:hypothetical protein